VRTSGPAVEKFLSTVGRRRLVMPVYESMHAKNEWWRALAKQTFERAKAMYHPITRESVEQLLAGKTIEH
jgi:leukotriene-A4 hydrolase